MYAFCVHNVKLHVRILCMQFTTTCTHFVYTIYTTMYAFCVHNINFVSVHYVHTTYTYIMYVMYTLRVRITCTQCTTTCTHFVYAMYILCVRITCTQLQSVASNKVNGLRRYIKCLRRQYFITYYCFTLNSDGLRR